MTREDRQQKMRDLEKKISSVKGVGAVYGLVKGLSVTMKTMLKPAITSQYPHEKPNLPPRSRGVIALKEENCTVCMLCSRECPDWCIYIDSHKDVMPPKTPGARPRTRNVLDRFAIDYALCMYCGICVEVCPFDALFWSPHFEYSTFDIDDFTHEMPQLGKWMEFVPTPPPLEDGADDPVELKAEAKVYGGPAVAAAAPAAAPQAPAEPAKPAPAEVPSAEGPAADSATTQGAATGTTEGAANTGAQAAPTAAPPEKDHEPPQIDEETFKAQMAAGKSEREARAMAKKAWVIKRRKGEI
ncbi:MAG TPA: NADH-quinone oxidoreductase subunit I [Actinomycetota bacterium]|nr:NADH-quinone oxidoreductase subunit I [Actinomycetota bacterium]